MACDGRRNTSNLKTFTMNLYYLSVSERHANEQAAAVYIYSPLDWLLRAISTFQTNKPDNQIFSHVSWLVFMHEADSGCSEKFGTVLWL